MYQCTQSQSTHLEQAFAALDRHNRTTLGEQGYQEMLTAQGGYARYRCKTTARLLRTSMQTHRIQAVQQGTPRSAKGNQYVLF